MVGGGAEEELAEGQGGHEGHVEQAHDAAPEGVAHDGLQAGVHRRHEGDLAGAE